LAGGLASSFLPGTLIGQDTQWAAAIAIFAASYLALAAGRVPGLAIDRAGVALVGACLMVAGGALPLADAYKAIDLDTLALLLGMMIVVANLRLSGFFTQASGWVMRRAHYPLPLLAAVTAVAGVFSAFLVNDAICLVLAPLVLELTLSLRRNPVPYLLAVAMASNIGSTATITGNPQNMMIGSFSQIPYAQFTASLAPVALVGLVLTFVLIALFHRDEFAGGAPFRHSFQLQRVTPQTADLLGFPAGIARGQSVLRLQFADRAGTSEPLRQHVDDRGIDIIDAVPQVSKFANGINSIHHHTLSFSYSFCEGIWIAGGKDVVTSTEVREMHLCR
jgi:hypothetical protein